MKVYLDTSVINVLLFGNYSEVDRSRYHAVSSFYAGLSRHGIQPLVSIYVLQEIYSFCVKICPPAEIETFSWTVLRELFKFNFGLAGLLSREKRLLNKRKFTISDKSDEPHVIIASLSQCDAIITYDEHFNTVHNLIKVYTPDEFINIFYETN